MSLISSAYWSGGMGGGGTYGGMGGTILLFKL